jgi:hypothetical protein
VRPRQQKREAERRAGVVAQQALPPAPVDLARGDARHEAFGFVLHERVDALRRNISTETRPVSFDGASGQ